MKTARLFTLTKTIAAVIFSPLLATATTMSFSPSAHAAPGDYVFTASFTAECDGIGWNYVRDKNGFNNQYIASTGNKSCAHADWNITGYPTTHTCDYYLFVPSRYGNAKVYPGLYDTIGHKKVAPAVDESQYTDVLPFIGTFSNIKHVDVWSNNGQTGTYIGLGTIQSLLVKNCR